MRRIHNILSKNWALVVLLLIGMFLRFYRLTGFVTFLGDQGRDAIIVKRILTLEHFPAIGAPTSIGQVYLGPFYYYFIAPWLLLFNYQPIGLAFGVAFFSSLYLLINYLITKDLFDKKVAFISTVFLTFSSVLISFSRFSWNPNLLPLFTLLTVFFVIKSIQLNKWFYYALAGAFLSFSIQLHYLALFLIPPIGILILNWYRQGIALSLQKNNQFPLKQLISKSLNLLISAISFILFSSPLIIFDLRHNFLNSRLFLALFKSSGTSFLTKINSFLDSFYYLNLYSFNISFNKFFIYVFVLSIFIILLTLLKKNSNFKTFLFIFLLTILEMSLYSGPKYPHYFGLLYPLYFVIVGYFITNLNILSWGKYLIILFIAGYIFLSFQQYPYFRNPSNNQITQAINISRKISDNITTKKYTITALPEKYSDSTYRYFLEIWGKRAIEKDSIDRADELFVVCEKNCLPIMGNPQWDIAFFAANKIVGEWQVEGVKIYKLIR